MFFAPAHQLDWMLNCESLGADAYVFELEDLVPLDQKDQARANIQAALERHKSATFGRFVRVNGWRTGHMLQDLLATVREGLDGVMVAKVEDAGDIAALELV